MARFITAEAFVQVWQSSKSLSEVAQKLQMKKSAARLRGFRYKRRGVGLKDFLPEPMPSEVNWESLGRLAAELIEPTERSIVGQNPITPLPTEA